MITAVEIPRDACLKTFFIVFSFIKEILITLSQLIFVNSVFIFFVSLFVKILLFNLILMFWKLASVYQPEIRYLEPLHQCSAGTKKPANRMRNPAQEIRNPVK